MLPAPKYQVPPACIYSLPCSLPVGVLDVKERKNYPHLNPGTQLNGIVVRILSFDVIC